MKNVLFIVYYFPPMGGSGVQRPLKFIKYLKKYGWNPIILCPEPGTYQFFDESLKKELEEISPEIHRVEAKTPFHLLGGKQKEVTQVPDGLAKIVRRILRLFMYPDNKKGWIEPAVKKGLSIIEEQPVDLIFSTAPPFSNHVIGARLSEKSKIPLVLDYRDSWLENQFFTDLFGWQKKIMKAIEARCLAETDCVTGLDEVTLEAMKRAYPDIDTRFEIVSHGFDPDDFEHAGQPSLKYEEGKLNLLYSGIFYESNQPDSFLEGVRIGLDAQLFAKQDLQLHFQGGLDRRIRALIEKLRLQDMVVEYGYLNHKEAVANLKKTDALWVLENFDTSLPQVKSGKLFEYFGAQKPILGVLNPSVAVDLIKEYGPGFISDVKEPRSISNALKRMIDQFKSGKHPKVNDVFLEKYNRKNITKQLAKIFDEISPH